MMEIRRVTADLLSQFDFSFAPGQSEKTFLDGKVDVFTLVAAPLWLDSQGELNSRTLCLFLSSVGIGPQTRN